MEPVVIHGTMAELQSAMVQAGLALGFVGFLLGFILRDILAGLWWWAFHVLVNWARKRRGLEPL
jgi:ABC-type multidrug transport system permease subunit